MIFGFSLVWLLLMQAKEESDVATWKDSGVGTLLYHLASKAKPQLAQYFKLVAKNISQGKLDSILRVDGMSLFISLIISIFFCPFILIVSKNASIVFFFLQRLLSTSYPIWKATSMWPNLNQHVVLASRLLLKILSMQWKSK